MPSVTKWKVVPPFMVIDVRGWLVSTKTGVWYGGSSPPHPFQPSAGQGPRIGPHMFPALIHPPVLLQPRAAEASSMPVVAPPPPNILPNRRAAEGPSCQ